MMSESRISLEETRHVARLSKLRYSEEELIELNQEMGLILDTVSNLERVPIDGLDATLSVGAYANRFREDQVGDCLDLESVLSNATSSRDGCFEIPRILAKTSE